MPLYYTGAKDGMVEQYNFRVFESILSTQSIIPHMESQYQKGLVIPRLFHELFIFIHFFLQKRRIGREYIVVIHNNMLYILLETKHTCHCIHLEEEK